MRGPVTYAERLAKVFQSIQLFFELIECGLQFNAAQELFHGSSGCVCRKVEAEKLVHKAEDTLNYLNDFSSTSN